MKHFLSLLLVLLGGALTASAENWSSWRGPEQTGVSRDTGLPDTFAVGKDAKNVLWKAPYGGITTPIVQNGRVYFINKVGEDESQQERVMCVDADSGKFVWEHTFNVFLTGIVADRLGWTQMVGDPETGNVYAHGTQGFLFCFDKDGKILWQHSLTEEYGRVSGYGGRIMSPIVFEDLLIMPMINASWGEQTVGGTRLAAFNKRTGAVVWWASANYRVSNTNACTPVVAKIGGQWLVLCGGGDGGLHAFKARTGEKVWSYIFGVGAINASPVVQDNRIYAGHGETNPGGGNVQGRVICLDGGTIEDSKPKLVWKRDGILVKYASPLLHADRLYVCNVVGEMSCLDAKDGKVLWQYQYGQNTRGSPVWADGKIYLPELDSKFHILKADDKGCEALCSVFFRGKGEEPVELVGSPAIANGRVYFLTSEELLCVGKKDAKGNGAKAAQPKAEKAEASAKAAHLQVVPADVALTPGQSVNFKALAYDDHGRLIGEIKAEWSLAGPLPPAFPIGMPQPKTKSASPPQPMKGDLSAKSGTSTKLTVGNDPPAQFGRVVAKANGLTAYARIRVAPLLPYTIDFAKEVPLGRTPGGWVNCQGKFAVAKMKDGTTALKKRNDVPSPLVARAYAFIGLPNTTGYTIQADVQGSKLRADLPDMGVDANHYSLVLIGNTQQLRLISWDALPRIDESIAFPWKPDVWYRMKLTVEVKGDKAIARGKVWPRDEPEPEKWTVEVEDSTPNRQGSPALYGYSTGIQGPTSPGTEIWYTNVKVTPNK
ncbi:MAG TPA: PQQ-binding-like beta-propeller repeat protein [Gemmataceae bacterium]|jgi:outer membrane protein assembly factor BamB